MLYQLSYLSERGAEYTLRAGPLQAAHKPRREQGLRRMDAAGTRTHNGTHGRAESDR